MRIVVVEPHPDDAFLSLGWHLEEVWKADQLTIVTVFSDARRTEEARMYAESIGATSVSLDLKESRMDSTSNTVKIVPQLKDLLTSLTWDKIVFPLGLQHPDHLSVAATRPVGSYRYIDTPYQTKQKLAKDLSTKVEGKVIDSICYPGAKKWKKSTLFKSQAKFFYFNPMADLRIPEIVLCPG